MEAEEGNSYFKWLSRMRRTDNLPEWEYLTEDKDDSFR